MTSLALAWFTTDLRLHDNKVLSHALSAHEFVLPVFGLDSNITHSTSSHQSGICKMGLLRRIFLYQSLLNLDTNLQSKGSKLIIVADKNLASLAQAARASAVYAAYQTASEETARYQKTASELAIHNIQLHLQENSSLYNISDLRFDINNLPDIFTQFRKQTENIAPIQAPLPAPDYIPGYVLDELAQTYSLPLCPQTFGLNQSEADQELRFSGGETMGLARIDAYFWQSDNIRAYKQTRNGLLISSDYSSKFSPWLAWGCLSPRYIYAQLKAYEAEKIANESTYWLYFELLWREYFRLVGRRYGAKIFMKNGLRNNEKNQIQAIKPNLEYIHKWINGQTGIPFIDANMLELAQTGYMSNRGRQNVASFLVHELGQNWQIGARYFEAQLLDYDVYSNWGNWQYVAGVGNDPRPNRHFNILRQARMYDTNGDFVRHWLPSLAGWPPNLIQTPWKSQLVLDYPNPLVLLEDRE